MDGNKTNKEKIDSALFDKTLRQIEKTLEELGEKIDHQEKLQINKKVREDKSFNSEEHTIDIHI